MINSIPADITHYKTYNALEKLTPSLEDLHLGPHIPEAELGGAVIIGFVFKGQSLLTGVPPGCDNET